MYYNKGERFIDPKTNIIYEIVRLAQYDECGMDINILETNYVVKFDISLVKNKTDLSYLYNYHKNGTYLLNEHLIEPYTVPNSLEVPDEKDYHMIVAASEDLLKVARDFEKSVNNLHTIERKEYQERELQFKQGTFWPEEDIKL